ncbi:MAG: glycosyltransferase [Desulfovibrionaceae bacterium]|jgi:glycosyltransferase involved in cell wall biosynthesis|nr:glycosyltransferase [Desulfovibrionaceae bacterium]
MKIAVLIPCYNEAQTVQTVVRDFRRALPEAEVYVFDNNSTDATAALAAEAGAIVRSEPLQGKGNVVRSMFRDVEADAYVMVDGDATYPAAAVRELLAPVLAGEADMAVGDRLTSQAYDAQNTRPMHGFGNRLVRWLINRLFRADLGDILSGYRAMSRYFVKTMPVMSSGFEIETELTLHALDKRFRIREVPVAYGARPEGSESKLNTVTDGARVLRTIAHVFKNYRPMCFFGWASAACFLLGLAVGAGPVLEYMRYAYVYKVPSAVLAAALEMLAMFLLCSGLILETIVRHFRERYELMLTDYKTREARRDG